MLAYYYYYYVLLGAVLVACLLGCRLGSPQNYQNCALARWGVGPHCLPEIEKQREFWAYALIIYTYFLHLYFKILHIVRHYCKVVCVRWARCPLP